MEPESGPQDPGQRSPPTAAAVLVTLLIFLAAVATIALFVIPIGNPWFWPTGGVLAISIGLGLLIPLRPH